MNININNLIPLTEANQNFSRVAKKVEKNGCAVILKNNKPKFLIVNFEDAPLYQLSDEEKFTIITNRVLKRNIEAFKELAK